MWDPTKPAPPVTKTFFMELSFVRRLSSFESVVR
jgi:hypothetical protein